MPSADALLQTFAQPEVILHPATAAIATILVIISIYIYGTYPFRILKKLKIPGPQPLAFSGNLKEVEKHGGLHLALLEYKKKYGKVFSLCMGRHVAVVVADPDMLRQILVKDFASFRNRFFRFPPNNKIKFGLMTAKDDDWKRIRSTLTPTFSSGKLKQMVSLIEESCDVLVEKLEEVADTGRSIDIFSWYSKMTFEVILSSAFGIKSDVQRTPDNEFLLKARSIFHPPAILMMLMALPGARLLRGLFSQSAGSLGYFLDLGDKIIRMRRECKNERQDLLQLMLVAHDPEGGNKGGLSDDEITAQSATFLLAGHETSSNALTFITYHLAMNPNIQEKLRQEISASFKENPEKSLYEQCFAIEYLDCVVNESLRMNPPAHVMTRVCNKTCTVNGVIIPEGMEVKYPIYALHHDPHLWTNPEKFDPDRFLSPAKDLINPFQFLPFGGGPRTCIGMRFAMLEIKMTLIKILRKHRFVRSPETQVPMNVVSGITLTSKDGLHIRLETF
ncbi:cytochrome P450 3A4-like [Actinia tenebrosa]|uniref:Cytochrome P450 3A4-like n=1 Tax=Actinia tenebrosa TaxID=6105 RepID=A0A6P8I9A9_ACTTE|nr:cytochrome P450 3A4-like [Actinia tenebrosa]XP_031561236.1 cytochrome P450 3A4-like [Actinia tenebrosa]